MQWVDSADIYIEQKEWLKAENALLNALRAEPANAQNSLLLSNLGTVQRYCGKYQEALDTYSMALFMTPRSSTLLRNRAALYAEMDSLQQACADYSHLIILDDTDEDALYNRALIYMQKGDTVACRKDLEYMLSNNPNSSNLSKRESRSRSRSRFSMPSRPRRIVPKRS
jgi:tetratricopeptide (TPR) repeat protein